MDGEAFNGASRPQTAPAPRGPRLTLIARLHLLVIAALLPTIAIMVAGILEVRRERIAEVHDTAVRLATFTSAEFDRLIDSGRTLLTGLAQVDVVKSGDAEACQPMLQRLIARFAQFATVLAVDRQGRLICSSAALEIGMDLSDRRWFREALEKGDFAVGEQVVGRSTGVARLPLSMPFQDGAGNTAGVLAVSIDVAWLNAYFESRSLPPDSFVGIVDRQGVVLVHRPGPGLLGKPVPEATRWILSARSPGTMVREGVDGRERIIGFVPPAQSQTGQFAVMVGLSTADALAPVTAATWRSVALLLLAVVLALGAIWIGGVLFLRRPITRLMAAVQRWRDGDFSARARLATGSELGELGRTFDGMAENLELTVEQLSESEQRHRHIVESARDYAIFTLDLNGHVTSWNLGAERILGFQDKEIVGRHFRMIFTPEDAGNLVPEQEMQVALSRGRGQDERWHRRKDGTLFWASGQLMPLRGPGGRIEGYLKILRDRTEQKAVDEALRMEVNIRRKVEGHQRLLMHELNHRVKNTLAIVHSLATETMRHTGPGAEFPGVFEARLQALARAHDLLTEHNWEAAGLAEVVDRALCPFEGTPGEKRIAAEGPSVMLAPKAALALAMGLHELATNAAKYGALSTPAGRVTVSWTQEDGAAGPMVRLFWRERGGPPVKPPTRRGFGRRLIERGLPGELDGEVSIDYAPEGVECMLLLSPNVRASEQF